MSWDKTRAFFSYLIIPFCAHNALSRDAAVGKDRSDNSRYVDPVLPRVQKHVSRIGRDRGGHPSRAIKNARAALLITHFPLLGRPGCG